MITVEGNILSGNIAMWYLNNPVTADILKALEGKITKECWRYLIGKMCISEKNRRSGDECVHSAYERMSHDFGYVHSSLKRLVNYANSIDRIQSILPDIALEILNGQTRLSLADTIMLAKMEFKEIRNIIERVACEKTPVSKIISDQKALLKKPVRRGRSKKKLAEPPRVTVKDKPQYDPDAQVNTLAYTIPSWISMIKRISFDADLCEASSVSRIKLIEKLSQLRTVTDSMTALIMEVE